MGQKEVEAQAHDAMQRFDVDSSGHLDFGEFMALITMEPWSLCLPANLKDKISGAAEKAAAMAEASRTARLQKTAVVSRDVRVQSLTATPQSMASKSSRRLSISTLGSHSATPDTEESALGAQFGV